MNDDITRNFKKIAREAEVGIARTLLRRRYRKEGKQPPGDEELQRRSRQVAEEARRTMVKSGRTAWKELKKVYHKSRSKDEGADS